VIKPLGTASGVGVKNVELLGFKGKVKWSQAAAGLTVDMPAEKPCDYAVGLKVALA
jgi:alpha-L-fucosidase